MKQWLIPDDADVIEIFKGLPPSQKRTRIVYALARDGRFDTVGKLRDAIRSGEVMGIPNIGKRCVALMEQTLLSDLPSYVVGG